MIFVVFGIQKSKRRSPAAESVFFDEIGYIFNSEEAVFNKFDTSRVFAAGVGGAV
ncbi:hypothetical protein AGMMS49546_03930 [Spirochaetia bacterium]|nr:hypothetical protein AGMMS49546_03930 [Spirochaetia bacterium]